LEFSFIASSVFTCLPLYSILRQYNYAVRVIHYT
jgi:hypothetical protein